MPTCYLIHHDTATYRECTAREDFPDRRVHMVVRIIVDNDRVRVFDYKWAIRPELLDLLTSASTGKYIDETNIQSLPDVWEEDGSWYWNTMPRSSLMAHADYRTLAGYDQEYHGTYDLGFHLEETPVYAGLAFGRCGFELSKAEIYSKPDPFGNSKDLSGVRKSGIFINDMRKDEWLFVGLLLKNDPMLSSLL